MDGPTKHNKRRGLGMRGALWMVIALTITCTVLGVSAFYAYQLHRTSYAADRLRARTITETYAMQVAARFNKETQNLAAIAESIPWHRDMRMLAVLNTDQQIVACRGNCQILEDYLNDPNRRREGASTVIFNTDEPLPIPNLHMAAENIQNASQSESQGTLVCAITSSQHTLWNINDIYYFFIRVALLMLIGCIFGFYWLNRTILMPLMALARATSDSRAKATALVLSEGRHDEIGKLARVFCDMQKDLERERQRAAHLERSLKDQVASQTKKVERELQQTKNEIWRDPLTKLGNRRLLEERFGDIFDAQCRNGEDLCIIMIDIDNFKNLNDTLGHKAGDKLLMFVGDLLRQFLRDRDFAIRYGGDEFTIVLTGVSINDAQTIADRIIMMFTQQAKLLPVEPKPTMSAGIASLCEHGPKTAESLLHLADSALYHAKKAGKCCAKVYTVNHVTPQPALK